VEAFAAKFNDIVTVTYTTSQKSILISIVIHDLTPFCKFEAYGGRHYGSVWRNHNSNVAAVVQPAIISFTQTFQKPKKPLCTKLQLHVNTMRWDGDEWEMSGDFNGQENNKTKFRKFTREAIWMRSSVGSTVLTEKIREDMWIVSSKLACLADLAALEIPVDVDTDAITNHLVELRQDLQGFMPRIEACLVACGCGERGCRCDDEEKEGRSEQHAALLSLVHAAELNAALCDERAREFKRVSSIYGCNFHPNTTCSSCNVSPIIGWKYTCTTCNVTMCENKSCIASHPDHELTLLRSVPAAAPGAVALVEAEQQRWRVNCIMGHWPIPKVRGDNTPRKFLYHVSWEGVGVLPTWEHEDALGNVELLASYQRQHQKKRRLELARCE
jgi:hypothetical protein